MKKIFWIFERHFEPVCIVTLISLMTLIIFLQIVLRVFDVSLPEAEEIGRYLFVWAMYLSISYAIRDDRHIRIVFLIDKLPPAGRHIACNCADIIFMGYSIAVTYIGYIVVNRSLELGQIAPATEVPVAILYASVVVGSALNIMRLAIRLHARGVGINQEQMTQKVPA